MMTIIDNLSFLGFLGGILYVIYWSVRYDDVEDGRKKKKFDIRANGKPGQDASSPAGGKKEQERSGA